MWEKQCRKTGYGEVGQGCDRASRKIVGSVYAYHTTVICVALRYSRSVWTRNDSMNWKKSSGCGGTVTAVTGATYAMWQPLREVGKPPAGHANETCLGEYRE